MHSPNIVHPATPTTFGEVRSLILETILNIRDGGLDVAQGMAMAANFKCLNDNILAEVASAKLSVQVNGTAHNFGKVVQMGTRCITKAIEDQTTLPQATNNDPNPT